MSGRVLRVRDVMRRLALSRRQVYRLIVSGALAATKNGTHWRVAERDVDVLAAQRTARGTGRSYGLSKPETHALILWAIARGEAARAALLTRALAHRYRVERAQRQRHTPESHSRAHR